MPAKKKVEVQKKGSMGLKVFVAGLVWAIIAQVIHMIEAMFTLDYYMDPSYFSFWSGFMMPTAGAPPAEFFIMSIAINTFVGMLITYVFLVLKDSIKMDNPYMRGGTFGWLLFLAAGIPSFLMLYMLLALPFGLIFSWLVSGLLVYVIGGAAIAKVLECKWFQG